MFDLAKYEARLAYNRDVIVRRWISGHGGVYVPMIEGTGANPYLKDVAERDVTTPSGVNLTLMNPAYVTRQLHEMQKEEEGTLGHLTSLNPIRPQNRSDEWETGALREFEMGAKEVSAISKINGKDYMRLMRPLVTEESCLKCHSGQGYKIGDVRGGISVAVPMQPIYAANDSDRMRLITGYFVTWLLGLATIVYGSGKLKKELGERVLVETALREEKSYSDSLVGKLEERNRQNAVMSEMREFMQACARMDEFPPVVARSMLELFPDSEGVLFIVGPSRRELEAVARWGNGGVHGEEENIIQPDACWALRRGRVYLVEESKSSLFCPHLKSPPPSGYCCIPLTAKGEVLGLLHIRSAAGSTKHERLTEALKEIGGVLSELLSLSIANIRLRETLSYQSIRDPLTGLFNRRYMEETLRLELLKSLRKGSGFGMIMADIDHFKEFNDNHGHAAGDTLLVMLSSFLTRNMRAGDVVCRYGGEEFLILLPDTGFRDAVRRAESLREEIKSLSFDYRGRNMGKITLSMGVSAYPDHGSESEHLLRTADAALYRAKNEGRDRVVPA